MTISKKINTLLANASFIRKMFEEGERLRKQFGEENVFDFSLGNPDVEPPKAFKEALKKLSLEPITGMHRYMSNAGYPETRLAVAKTLAEQSGLPLNENHIVMTCGAGGALNVALKTILDPGDEVIILSPFFVEYKFYIDNHGGVVKEVATTAEFELDLQAIDTAISAKTKAIIINTPNNPTGVVYGADSLANLGKLLENKEKEIGHPVFVISDEPYAKIAYDGITVPSVFKYIKNSIVVTSHSKDLALPGERIGYAAISPNIERADLLMEGLVFCNRTLGFVNAPALMQRLVAGLQHESVNVAEYQEKRDLLYDNLTAMGFKMIKPQGAFYIFPQSPVKNDVEFAGIAQKHNILVVPGSGFGTPGYFRISYCVNKQMILRSLPAFQALASELGLQP
ncbi:pyridoxal phosphate-dependent aminotransferase [Pelotomaculum terephthalicicum JT]|uniref:pyridoxal phosphate-dependent aminotransferase n=1 Tax=Pelotomaculum TaxID=191373 RepID=UPI0009C74AE1|nr:MULTISPECIES: pyridoxal phosphate-dependent aminotransferase [Pelotomaculum]MCG9969344.1 pyridoxal phosphate-dependent aminotransferase [Pelotomaculum terephthalicicum JT]OPX86410.1 MAG: Aspartate aminotransferase [Pelotomaculum sp. PtaB.Bin117]OPY62129.1 MAG: Aspartate aminotransferase [Pelotomaculum sp. PtaU1.Bin065]